MLLVSLKELKIFLEKSDTDVTHDALLGMIIEFVSDKIQKYLDRDLAKEYRVSNFNAGRKKYFLPAFPIDSVANVTVSIADNLLEQNSDFFVWKDLGMVELLSTSVYIEPQMVEISWLGGYEVSTVSVGGEVKDLIEVPDSIKFATLLQSSFVYRQRLNIGVTSVALPNGNLQGIFFGDLLPEVRSILNSYRNVAGDI